MISKKKKKKVFAKIQGDFSSKISQLQTFQGGLFSHGGAIFNFSQKIGLKSTKNMRFCILRPPPGYATGNTCCILARVYSGVSNRTWTVNPNEPFHFGEPELNLNQQNFTSVNLNQTWTPNKSKNIFFHIQMPLALIHAYKSSGDHQQDQQFLLFFLDETSNAS